MATDHFVSRHTHCQLPAGMTSPHHRGRHQHQHVADQGQQQSDPLPVPSSTYRPYWGAPRSAPTDELAAVDLGGQEPMEDQLMELEERGNHSRRKTSQGATQRQPQPPGLPHPNETPANAFPPEIERESNNWRQYAVSVLFRAGRKLTGPARTLPDEAEEEEEEEEAEEGVNPDEEEEALFRGRRRTVTYKFPTTCEGEQHQQRQQLWRGGVARKLSMGQQRHSTDEEGVRERKRASRMRRGTAGGDEDSEGPEQVMMARSATDRRRLSVPAERSLLNANYAILRKSVDKFEVIGAFHRCHSEAYRHFLQSLTCYDLAPQHGLVVMLDAQLSIQKAFQILCAHPAPRVAVIWDCRQQWANFTAMFTVTDCLMALQRAHRQGDAQLATQSLSYFVEQMHGSRRLISVNDQMSVWDLARVFSLNRVHRIPVFSGADTNELIAVLCPRAISVELLKLVDSKCSLSPDLQSTPLNSVGTWSADIATVTEGESCARAVDLFLDKQVSALPIRSAADGSVLAVVDKNDLLDKLFEQLGAHHSPERCFQLIEETAVESLLPLSGSRRRTLRSDLSLADALRMLAEDGLTESLFVVDQQDRLVGVLSHTDILAFILNCEQQDSGGGSNGSGSGSGNGNGGGQRD